MYNYLPLFFILTSLLFCSCQAQNNDLLDSRDQQRYPILQIGNQTWMAKNLNFNSEDSYCYKEQLANCESHGRFYTFEAATKACPPGWKLPSNEDWMILEKSFGISDNTILTFRTWRTTNNFDQSIEGFNVKYSGIGDHTLNGFQAKDSIVRYWSRTNGPTSKQFATYRMFMTSEKGIYSDQIPKKNLCCVRCIKQ